MKKKLLVSAVLSCAIAGVLSVRSVRGDAAAFAPGEVADDCWCANAHGIPGPACIGARAHVDCEPRGGDCVWLCE